MNSTPLFTTTEPPFRFRQGTRPLLISMPHVGTHLPPQLASRLSAEARRVPDTDWHLDKLYKFLPELGASVLQPHYSRYLIDLNRPPDDAPMYPGAANTELCPTRFFTSDPLYLEGRAPTPQQRMQRRQDYWQPYHDALQRELMRLKSAHGYALLLDGHSIKSEVPWLFTGRLPDLNLGTAGGATCAWL